jgi:hypothetical protein
MPQTKKIFTSKISFQDAENQALQAGFRPIGKAVNRSMYVVFGRR